MAVRFTDFPYTTVSNTEYSYSRFMVVAKRGKASGELYGPRGIAVDSNSHIFIVEEYPPRLSIFSEKGEFLKTFSHEEMASPWGIAIHRDNVYVTDSTGHSVLHFQMTTTDIRLVARTEGYGSVHGKFMRPRQLTVSVSGEIFVTDYLNNRIQILDSYLKYRRCISHESMIQPNDVKVTEEEVYVLTYSSSHCIHVFSITGVKLRFDDLKFANSANSANSIHSLDFANSVNSVIYANSTNSVISS